MSNSRTRKKCRRCQRMLSIGRFARSARARDGYQLRCRDCQSLERKERKKRTPGYGGGKRAPPGALQQYLFRRRDLTPKERKEIMRRGQDRCFFCKQKIKGGHMLHMLIPPDLGGRYTVWNLRACHPRCPDRCKRRARRLAEEFAKLA